MRHRKQIPTPPAPATTNEASINAAKAVAAAINQGLPGDQFANLMNVMSSKNVKLAASLTLPEVIAWFQEDATAAAILKACPGFEQFAAAFHARARAIYPPPAA